MTKIICSVCVLFLLGNATLHSQAYRRPATRYIILLDQSHKKVEELRIYDKIQVSHADGSMLKGEIIWIDTAYVLIDDQQIKCTEINSIKKLGNKSNKFNYPVTLESSQVIDSSEYAIRFVNPAELPSSNHLVIYKTNKPVKTFYLGDRITYKLGTSRQYYGVIKRIEEDKLFFARGDSATIGEITAVRNRKPNTLAGVGAMSSGVIVLLLTVGQANKEERKSELSTAIALSSIVIAGGIVLVTSSWHEFEKNKSINVVHY